MDVCDCRVEMAAKLGMAVSGTEQMPSTIMARLETIFPGRIDPHHSQITN